MHSVELWPSVVAPHRRGDPHARAAARRSRRARTVLNDPHARDLLRSFMRHLLLEKPTAAR
ncbi:hypothetical protein PSAC2689_270003 [Paraburkholderia sacchari]